MIKINTKQEFQEEFRDARKGGLGCLAILSVILSFLAIMLIIGGLDSCRDLIIPGFWLSLMLYIIRGMLKLKEFKKFKKYNYMPRSNKFKSYRNYKSESGSHNDATIADLKKKRIISPEDDVVLVYNEYRLKPLPSSTSGNHIFGILICLFIAGAIISFFEKLKERIKKVINQINKTSETREDNGKTKTDDDTRKKEKVKNKIFILTTKELIVLNDDNGKADKTVCPLNEIKNVYIYSYAVDGIFLGICLHDGSELGLVINHNGVYPPENLIKMFLRTLDDVLDPQENNPT